jgi:hypothetical protein
MAWLTGELARRKRPLRAGEIALSGALGTMCLSARAMLSKRRSLVSPGSPKRDVRLV